MSGVIGIRSFDHAIVAVRDLEAATESLGLKRAIFEQVESIVDDSALLTSNTSSLPAERIFAGMRDPGRCTVTHFFAPAFRNPVVEVVDWDGVTSETVEHLRWLFAHTGKLPLVTADAVCFMLDRIFDNCPRYLHDMRVEGYSRYVPEAGKSVPVPDWKRNPDYSDALPQKDLDVLRRSKKSDG